MCNFSLLGFPEDTLSTESNEADQPWNMHNSVPCLVDSNLHGHAMLLGDAEKAVSFGVKICTVLGKNKSSDANFIVALLQTVSVTLGVDRGSTLDGGRFDFEVSGWRVVVTGSTAGRDDDIDGVDGVGGVGVWRLLLFLFADL